MKSNRRALRILTSAERSGKAPYRRKRVKVVKPVGRVSPVGDKSGTVIAAHEDHAVTLHSTDGTTA